MDQEKLQSFINEHVSEMVLVMNADGIIEHASASAKAGMGWHSLEGAKIEEIFPNEWNAQWKVGILEGIQFGEGYSWMAYRENRTCFNAYVRVFYFEKCLFFFCKDASQRDLLEKKLVQAQEESDVADKIKSEFVANVTHELRTPVNGISGNVKELQEMETDPKKLKLLDFVQQGCRNMNAIINNILDFSKLDAGKFNLEMQEFELEHMIEFVRSNHKNKMTEKGLDFVINVSPEVPKRIIGDELRIGQILNNLLSNAYKFTSVGKISVDVVKTAQFENRAELFFMVMDTGIGIKKADQDKLFHSFSQVDASISRRYGGTGLGLNICKQLTELMDGDIQVESEEGKGSNFTFHIWVELPQGAEQETAESMDVDALMQKIHHLAEQENTEKVWEFGTTENKEELNKKMSRLIICIEMENWEKAEMFMDGVRQLTEHGPKEVKTAALRLKMAVQKANQEKAEVAYHILEGLLEDENL